MRRVELNGEMGSFAEIVLINISGLMFLRILWILMRLGDVIASDGFN